MNVFRVAQFLFFHFAPLVVVAFVPSTRVLLPRGGRATSPTSVAMSDGSIDDQAIEALKSMADFHDGQWQGKTKSFTVTADTAAGILQRKDSSVYKTTVKLGLDVTNRDFTLQETLQWDDDNQVASRKVSLQSSNVDIDAVDGSYSLDQTLPDLPADLVGTSKLAQFMIEHCLAVSDDCRARCWALYGVDGSLIRVVVSEETRVKSTATDQLVETDKDAPKGFTAADLLEMQSDVDRLVDKITGESSSTSSSASEDRLGQLTDRIASSSSSSSNDGEIDLTLHTTSLLELSSGVWLGDVIIRDHPNVATSREQRGQGFGAPKKDSSRPSTGFAEWSVGVQKIAWRWMWNFGQEIRQVNDIGKAMGAELVPGLASSLAGNVCVNEGLSRRIPISDRMVYLDWSGDDVGFLVGSFSIQLPRYLTFDRTQNNSRRPLATEFAVYQSAPSDASDDENEAAAGMPKLVCSRSTRVYNFEGLLKQGCTSFFSFKRFGTEKDAL